MISKICLVFFLISFIIPISISVSPTPCILDDDSDILQENVTNNSPSCVPPKRWDWREKGVVSSIKQQGACHSCWAFAIAGAIEGINAIKTGKLIDLSPQQLVNCDTKSKGCESGKLRAALNWVVSNGGIASEANVPYLAKKGTCTKPPQVPNAASIKEFRRLPNLEKDILCAVTTQPIIVGVNGAGLKEYKDDIYEGPECSKTSSSVNHAMLIVGYDSKDGVDYWIVKNSWGTKFGENGYIRFKRDPNLPYGLCAINYRAYQVFV